MKSVCLGVFRELLMFSAVVLSDASLPMSSMKECIEQKAQKVVIRNIGIKMCQARCIETGGCLRFEFDFDTLTCRLRFGDLNGMEKNKKSRAHLKTYSYVIPGPCSTTSCSLGARCLGSRSGKPLCVIGGRTFYPSRSPKQRRGKKSRSGYSLLHEACREGNVSQVRTIMSQGQVDIDSRDEEYGRTPVMLAARGGHRVVFEFLVEIGCNMSLLDNNDSNILHMACYGGQIAIVKLVLSLEIVDINGRGHYGRTCVMVAAHRGNIDLLKYIVKQGGDVLLLDITGDNILHIACRGGNVEMVKYIISQDIVDINSKGRDARTVGLIAAHLGYRNIFDLCTCAGCNLSAVDAKGNNILHMAILGGHTRMVKHVLTQRLVNINSRGMDGKTPLMFAAFEGHREVFDSILSEGGDPSHADNNGDTILHWVCRGGHVEMVKYVISQNVTDINSRGRYGRTPIMLAAYSGHREVFDFVMSNGGDASLVDRNGDTILHWVCRGGHVEMVKYIILQNFTRINKRGYCEGTPVMVAAYYGHRNVFDLLLSKGGDASFLDKNGDNILHWACRGGHVEMAKHIILKNFTDSNSRGHNGKTPMMVAAAKGHREVFDTVMSKGGDPSLVDRNGDNILHWAFHGGNAEMVKYIISQNFTDVDSRGYCEITPMMLAAYKGYREVFDLVMSKGGDASHVDKNGDNILHWVCHGGHVEMVKHIISQNVTGINSRGQFRWTPLMVAAYNGHRKVFDMILSRGGNASLVDMNGGNILHLAIRQGHVMMVKHILSKNIVDVNAKDNHGKTAAMTVNKTKHKEMYDLLTSLG